MFQTVLPTARRHTKMFSPPCTPRQCIFYALHTSSTSQQRYLTTTKISHTQFISLQWSSHHFSENLTERVDSWSTRVSSFPRTMSRLPPVPVSSWWNSWFEAVIHHATRIHLYEGFYKAEKGQGKAIEHTFELVTHKTIYNETCLQLYFIKENCRRLMAVLTSLEAKEVPLACTVYNLMEDLWSYLRGGISKSSLGVEMDRLLAKYPAEQKRKHIKSFQTVFKLSPQKLEEHWDAHPAYLYYKAKSYADIQPLFFLDEQWGRGGAICPQKKVCMSYVPPPEVIILDQWWWWFHFIICMANWSTTEI